MTSRTNRRSEGDKQKGETSPSPSALQQRRAEALDRYLKGEPIEVICREMGCAKSWLYKWKKRYQATEPGWVQARSRRPRTAPTTMPDALAAKIVRLRQTLSSDRLGPVSADVMQEHLRQHGGERVPSRRTIYRILNRSAKEINAPSFPS